MSKKITVVVDFTHNVSKEEMDRFHNEINAIKELQKQEK